MSFNCKQFVNNRFLTGVLQKKAPLKAGLQQLFFEKGAGRRKAQNAGGCGGAPAGCAAGKRKMRGGRGGGGRVRRRACPATAKSTARHKLRTDAAGHRQGAAAFLPLKAGGRFQRERARGGAAAGCAAGKRKTRAAAGCGGAPARAKCGRPRRGAGFSYRRTCPAGFPARPDVCRPRQPSGGFDSGSRSFPASD